ncbi:MAG: Crp/Fnr family transcriptional regulator [Roseivirga sp.]|nr:Crp/Fnr family transcriptional regulator [Roseivirga sp.]
MDIQDIVNLQLRTFREPALKELMASCNLVEVPEGGMILKEGSYVKTVPILLSGLAKVVKEEDGKEILLYNIYPLESCIMSISCSLNQEKSPVKALAEQPSKALLIPAHKIGDWQRQFPSFNQYVMDLYGKRFNDILDAFNALAFQNLDQRIMAYFKAKIKNAGSTRLYITHQEIADELGTSRETVSRLLKKLEHEGIVALHRGWVELI